METSFIKKYVFYANMTYISHITIGICS